MTKTNERAAIFLDNRLTGAEALIAIDLMTDFAAQEVAAETASLTAEVARLKKFEIALAERETYCDRCGRPTEK